MRGLCNLVPMDPQQAAYERLGNAVVEQTAIDYLSALRRYRDRPNWRARYDIAECEWFFCTKRIQYFSAIDGKKLMEDLRDMAFTAAARRKIREGRS